MSAMEHAIVNVEEALLTAATQDLEQQLVLREANRRAEMLAYAARLDEAGLDCLANALLQRIEELNSARPLASMPVKDVPVMRHEVQPDVLKLAAKYLGVVRPRVLVHGNGHAGQPDADASKVKRLGRKST